MIITTERSATQSHRGNQSHIFREGAVNGLSSPYVIQSPVPLSRRTRDGAVHEEHLRRFVQTWRLAMAVPVSLPPTADPNYASLDALGRHVLTAAGGYLVWMCEMLRLPDPGVRPAADTIAIVRDAGDYLAARV